MGLKKEWKLSGLTFYEFTQQLIQKNIEPVYPDAWDDKFIENALKTKISDIFPNTSLEELREFLQKQNPD